MRVRSVPFILLLTCVLVMMGQAVMAAKATKIELRDGTIYESVDYKVDNIYKTLTIEGKDLKRTVSFTDVRQVIDIDGVDVTEDCLGRYYNPTPAPEKVAPTAPAPESGVTDITESIPESARSIRPVDSFDPETARVAKHPFSVGFKVGPNYSFPTGDWYWGIKSGVGYDFDLTITVARRMALRASISKSGARHNPEELFEGGEVIQDDLSFQVWRYLIGLEYYNWPRWRSKGKVMTFAYGGLGMTSHKLTGSAVVYDPYLDELWMYTGNGKVESKFTFSTGGGVDIMVGKSVGLELSAELDLLMIGGSQYEESASGLLFDLKLGLIFLVR